MAQTDTANVAADFTLNLDAWNYADHFQPLPSSSALHPIINNVEEYVEEKALDAHPFFEEACTNQAALNLWISQEVVMTNAFSQIVLFAASRIKNVHLRTVLCDVAYGEHGKLRSGCARGSHPWLLHQLRASVEIDENSIRPHNATKQFIARLVAALKDPLEAIAAIGIGNERLIVPEYSAIKRCFKLHYPHAEFEPFLDANLSEDIYHAKLCYIAASSLITNDLSAQAFLDASKNSVNSRILYFDDLLRSLK